MRNKSLISFVALLVMACSARAVEKTVEARPERVLELYSTAPAAFIENAGQIADPTVHYVFRGSGANIYHTTKGPVFQLFQQEKPGQGSKNYRDEPAEYRGFGRYDKKDVIRRACSLSMRFIGASRLRPIGHGKQETKVNYFIGGDPNKWHTNVATYSKVVYPELYDGISLHTFGRKSHLKYEFHVAAGANYRQIVVTYEGAGDIKIDSNGALHINTPLGELVDGAPYVYQIINGQQVQIPGRYRLIDENSYTFEISGRVDPRAELVIDPYLVWARSLGGNYDDGTYGIAVDPNGNALLTGCTYSSNFEGATIANTNSYGNCENCDAFVAKVSSSGDLLWVTFLCGTDDDWAYGIAEGIDDQGSYAVVTGATASDNFPVIGDVFQSNNVGGIDAFVAKLYSSGGSAGHLRWSSYLGGTGDDRGYAIAVDSLNSKAALLTGATGSPSLPPDCECNLYDPDSNDVFVAKISESTPNEPKVEWCDCRGGSDNDWGYAVSVDTLGNSLVVGASASCCYFTTTVFTDYGGGKDVFVAKFDPDGNIEGSVSPFCGWLGGSEDDEGYGITTGIDKNGFYALLTGYTKSDDFPQVQGYCCGADAFVARINYLNPDQNSLITNVAWVKCLAGSDDEQGRDIATGVDDEGTTYGILTGWTTSYDFPTTGLFKAEHSGGTDAFVARVNENISGTSCSVDWAGYLGGRADDKAYGIDTYMDLQGNRYAMVAGETNSTDFPTPEPNTWWDTDYRANKDGFVAKICTDGIIGQGKLHGNVWLTDGTPFENVEVTVPGQQTSTDVEGKFSFDSEDGNPQTSNVWAGYIPVKIEEDGYYPAARVVAVDPNSTTHVNIVMIAVDENNDKPVVVELYAYFCEPDRFAYYMDGPSFYEKFNTTIDWPTGCEPNRIEWRIKDKDENAKQTAITDCSGISSFSLGNSSTHSWCFDMGSDFGVGGTLEVVAVGNDKVSGYEVISDPRPADFFEVIAPPPYVVDANKDVAVLVTGDGFEYKMLVPGFDMATWSKGNGIPFFKGEMMNVGVHPGQQPAGPRIIGMVYGDGTSDVFTQGIDASSKKEANAGVKFEGGIDLPKLPRGIEAEVKVTAQFAYTYDDPPGNWTPSGGLDVACVFSFSSPYYYVAVIGPVPIYSAAEVSLALGLSSSLEEGWGDMGPTLSSNFFFEPLLKGILGAGIADVACVEGYLGGGFHAELELYPELKWGGQYIILVGGVDVYIGSFSVGGGELRYSWWPNPGESKIIHERGFGSVGIEYRDPGVSADLGMNEEIVEPNEFPYCVPKLVPLEGAVLVDNMLMVWLHDNRGRPSINDRTELRYATYHESDWVDYGAVADDGTADMNPQLISLGSGRAACIWQNAKDTLADCNDLRTLNSNLEVTLATYYNASWTEEWTTNNASLDRSPKLAVDENDASSMLAVWISNQDGNMWGDSTAVNKIKWRKYSNVWDVADSTIDANFGMILGTALAYKDGIATYVFCRDGDNDISSPNDQDLWIAWYSTDGGWSGPELLTTDDEISDAAPRLIYDPSIDELLLFWIRGDEVRMAKEPNFIDPSKFEPDTDSNTVPSPNGLKDFDVVMGQQGQIALIWSSVSVPIGFPKSNPNLFNPECIEPNCIKNDPEHYDPNRLPVYMNPECVDPNLILVNHDIWVSYRDSYFGLWSMPRQLTWDDAAERFMSGAFESDGTLLCVYNKRQTEYNTVDCNCTDCDCNEPHHPISVANVPGPGKRSDLVYLNDDLTPDLSIEVEDVKVLPPNPMPGTWAKVSAEVKNLGISPAWGTMVSFSDDSAAGIWIPPVQQIVGPLVGGAASEVSVWWKVPPSISPRTITVAIQSFDGIPEDPNDTGNNSVSFKVLAPDLTINEMNVHSIGPDTHVVTVRVANDGVLPIGTNYVVLRESDPCGQYDPHGDILSGEYIQDIDPIAYQDVPFTLSSGQLSGVERIYATVEIIPFAIVDNFESYTSYLNDVWEGSPNIPDGGVAYLETDVVHFGEQSMQFVYNHTDHSVLRRIYGSARDWTEDGVTTLRLHFYGDANDGAGNTADEMSVTLEDSDGHSATIPYNGDVNDLSAKAWLEWEIDLQDFNDAGNVDPYKIVKVELGISGGATGRIYFDDILLYSLPTGSMYFDDILLYSLGYVPGDMNGDCVVDYADLKIMSEKWLGHGPGLAADLDGSSEVDFIDYSIFSDYWREEFARPTYIGTVYNVNEFNEDNNFRSVRIR